MLEATGLECVRSGRRLFKDVTFCVRAGELFQLTGANGSGKTSLLRMLCGLLPPASGEVRWQGNNIRTLAEEYFPDLTYLGHRPGLKDDLTALENLQVACGLAGRPISQSRGVAALERLGLAEQAYKLAKQLSEGQRRRVALARLVVCETPLWLLDEVTASLDSGAVQTVMSLIGGHLAGGGLAVIATHQELSMQDGSYGRIDLAA